MKLKLSIDIGRNVPIPIDTDSYKGELFELI